MSEKRALFPKPRGPLRVAIDSQDPLVKRGLEAALAGDSQIELTETGGANALLVCDLGPDRTQARERLASFHRASPADAGAVLVLCADPDDAQLALSSGARGVMLRELDGPKLCAALKAIAHGLTVLDAALAERVHRADPQPGSAADALTPRELEVLRLLADGLSNKRIGRELGISEHTAKFHVNAILEKLDADSRTAAVVIAVRRGLLWL